MARVFKMKSRDGWWIDYTDPQGKRIRIKSHSPYKEGAEREKNIIQDKIARGEYTEGIEKNPLFEEAAAEYQSWSNANKAPASALRDTTSIKALSHTFNGHQLRDISPKLIEDYKTQRVKVREHATVNRELACLRSLYNRAIVWGYAIDNPVKGVKFFKETMGLPRFLSMEECQRLLSASEKLQGWNKTTPYLKAIILTGLHTGLRKSNIMGLRWDQVDLKNRLITVPRTKNGEFHSIPISDTLLEELRKLLRQRLQGAEWVFAAPGKEAQRDLRKAWERAKKEAGIDKRFRFHDLRHTFASHKVMAGVDLRTVQVLMGHKDITMTLRYAHLSPQHLHDAINSFPKDDVIKNGKDLAAGWQQPVNGK